MWIYDDVRFHQPCDQLCDIFSSRRFERPNYLMIRVCSCAFVVELYLNRQDSLCLCPICAKLLIRSPCREKIPNGTRRNPNSQMVFAFRMDQWSPRIARRGEMSAISIMSGFRGFKGCQCYSRSRVIHAQSSPAGASIG